MQGAAVGRAAACTILKPFLASLLLSNLSILFVVLCCVVLQGTLTEGSQISLMPTGQVSKVDSIYINEER